MAYEEEADIGSTLVPLEARRITLSDGNIPPRTKRGSVLATPSGRIITHDLPWIWVQFMADACNKYFEDEYAETDERGKVIAKLQLWGEPRIKEDSRQVAIDENNVAYIARTMVYNKWITRNKQNMKRLFSQKPKLPIDKKVHIQFMFYTKPRRKGFNPSIGDYVSAGIDCLRAIGVLSDVGRKNVVSVDGSRILTDYIEPRTEVWIREVKE